MKYSISLLLLLLTWLHLPGQSTRNYEEIEFDFVDGDGVAYNGNKVLIQLALMVGKKQQLYTLSPSDVLLDCEDQADAQIIIEIKDLKWANQSPKFLKNAQLVIARTQVVYGPQLDFILDRPIKVQQDDPKGISIFKILENGEGKFSIDVHVATAEHSINTIKKRSPVFKIERDYNIINYNPNAVVSHKSEDTSGAETVDEKPFQASTDKEKIDILPPADNEAEENDWIAIRNSNNKDDFEQYLIKYPKGHYFEKATENYKRLSPISYNISLNGMRYTIKVENVFEPDILAYKLDSSDRANFTILADNFKTTHEFIVEIKENGVYKIPIADNWGKTDQIDLDKVLFATLDSTAANKDLFLSLTGGFPPYRIDFKKIGSPIVEYRINEIRSNNFSIPYKELIDNNLEGEYELVVMDRRASAMVPIQETVMVAQPFQIPLLGWIGIGFIGVSLLFLFLRSLMKRRKPKKQQVIEEKRKQALESNLKNAEISKIGRQTITLNTAPPKPKPELLSQEQLESKIKIKNLGNRSSRTNHITPQEFDSYVSAGAHHKLEMGHLWNNSAISEVHMNHKCISDLAVFLKGDQSGSGRDELDGFTPEIGGFLLGQYAFQKSTKDYKVSLEEFVPITPENHTVFQLEFSTKSLVKELGDAQDQFPHLSVLGWFHTHPGHGLFLSKPDLVIHKGFFREKYQLAMEIDNLSSQMDTGFFTRTKQGKINNSLTAKVDWFSWKKITETINS